MNELDRKAIRDRLAAATPGPWGFGGIGVASEYRRIAMTCLDSEAHLRDEGLVGYGEVRDQDVANGEFIAHAPTDIADLLDTLEAAEALIDDQASQIRQLTAERDRLEEIRQRDDHFIKALQAERDRMASELAEYQADWPGYDTEGPEQ